MCLNKKHKKQKVDFRRYNGKIDTQFSFLVVLRIFNLKIEILRIRNNGIKKDMNVSRDENSVNGAIFFQICNSLYVYFKV